MTFSRSVSLSARALACERDQRLLFSGLEFELGPGQTLLVEGRNGSGKTSLLRILCGMRRQDAGAVHWCGRAIERLGGQYRSQLAFIGHADGIKQELTVSENLSVARALGVAGDADVESAIARVGLSGYEDVLCRKLSAGQRRRVALARLLVTAQPLWIVDEPFTSLDREGVDLFRTLMREHADRGGILVFTSHHGVELQDRGLQRLRLAA